MTKYNVNFELSVEDMELIEDALRRSKRALSKKAMAGTSQEMKTEADAAVLDDSVRQIHDLLGRLHNQKVFYRPASGAYIGG